MPKRLPENGRWWLPCLAPQPVKSQELFLVSGLLKHRSRNKWRKLPACDDTIYRKLEAYATVTSDSYFSNGANQETPAA
jgi:hypothetical protein